MSWAMVAVAGAALVSAGVSYTNGRRQQKAAEKANKQAQAQADAQLAQADQQFNAQNMKSPDTASMLSSAMLSSRGGAAGTMLTGSGGVGRDKLKTQAKTLLGQ